MEGRRPGLKSINDLEQKKEKYTEPDRMKKQEFKKNEERHRNL